MRTSDEYPKSLKSMSAWQAKLRPRLIVSHYSTSHKLGLIPHRGKPKCPVTRSPRRTNLQCRNSKNR
jgi:hypothetical protein